MMGWDAIGSAMGKMEKRKQSIYAQKFFTYFATLVPGLQKFCSTINLMASSSLSDWIEE
jgi:hypothetical protein